MQKNIWIAAKYLRLSIEDGDKAESESIVNQSILIDNYMKSTSDITIVETFKDDGFSGTDFKRPGFQAMLKAIENKEINCIIVKDLSRFGREHIDVDRYIQKVFPQLGVRFIAINDNYDSETANITDTHLVLPVKSFVNDTYCRQNSQKVRSHLSAKRNIGEYVGNYVSYGYKKCDADKSQIEIDPVAAKHVRDIFNWKMECMSNQLIADKLNELGVLAPADYKRATNDSFMLAPSHFKHDEIVALDRAYINYEKFEELTKRNVVYVTKMKKNLKYEVLADCMDMNEDGLMEYREQVVVFRKGGINHIARIITYVDIKKGKMPKLVSLLTNDFDMSMETIVAIYRRRWQIETLFKQIKQNFPLRYFYGESANAIKIQIWVTLIANLLLSLLQSSLQRRWSFSGLATMVRIVLMEYLNMNNFFNMPDADMKLMLEAAAESPPEVTENE